MRLSLVFLVCICRCTSQPCFSCDYVSGAGFVGNAGMLAVLSLSGPLHLLREEEINREMSVAHCVGFCERRGKAHWEQGEGESWRLTLHISVVVLNLPFAHVIFSTIPPSLPPVILRLFLKCWLNNATAQLEKMEKGEKKKKDEKGWPFVRRAFVPFPHPQQLPGVASAALGLAGCTNSLAEFGGGAPMCLLAAWERC